MKSSPVQRLEIGTRATLALRLLAPLRSRREL
jgi:hypothetical protein